MIKVFFKFYFLWLFLSFEWGKKNSKRKAGVIENYFPTMHFFFTPFFFIVACLTIFDYFIHLPFVFLGLSRKKNSKFKTEETGVMENPLVHQAFSFHFTNLSHCCERLLASTCFEHRTLDCCCWEMFLWGWTKF